MVFDSARRGTLLKTCRQCLASQYYFLSTFHGVIIKYSNAIPEKNRLHKEREEEGRSEKGKKNTARRRGHQGLITMSHVRKSYII